VFCGDLGEETNNGPTRATAWVEAEAGKHYGLCKIDVDWFSYPAINDGSSTLELTLSWNDSQDGNSDITCFLYKKEDDTVVSVGGCVGSKTDLGGGWSQIVASNALTPNVVHYVAVLPAQGFGDQYDIEFTLGIEPSN
jgi:hypothetical protein